MSSLWLRDNRRSVTSSTGEDGVLEAIFDRIGAENKWCCEFGALDGKTGSNTWNLIHNHGWRGILIEGDPERYKRLLKNVPSIGDAVPVQAFVGSDGPDSLDNILARSGAPADIDLVSIDIDNDDYFVWQGLHNHKPRVVLIEVNSQWPLAAEKIPVPGYHGFTYRTGASLRSMVQLAKSKGYELALHTANGIFVRRDVASKLDIDESGWEELFDRSWVNRPAKDKLAERSRDLLRMALGKHYTTVGSLKKKLQKRT